MVLARMYSFNDPIILGEFSPRIYTLISNRRLKVKREKLTKH